MDLTNDLLNSTKYNINDKNVIDNLESQINMLRKVTFERKVFCSVFVVIYYFNEIKNFSKLKEKDDAMKMWQNSLQIISQLENELKVIY